MRSRATIRLVHVDPSGVFQMREFSDEIPKYAILSHTWGSAHDDEVSFQDIQQNKGYDKPGAAKMRFCQAQALEDGLQYFWIDTCCLDQSNKLEMNQAINSMFSWYKNAAVCYALLADVPDGTTSSADTVPYMNSLKRSRWFRRGWTLQDLIAPSSLKFFSKDGHLIGTRNSLAQVLQGITGIPVSILEGEPLLTRSVEERLSWMETRQTAVPEDEIYSMLGILDVNIDIEYGEGRRNASERLRQAIERRSHQKVYIKPLRKTHFRLVRLHHGHIGKALVCTVETYDLGKHPGYIALSYVWGEEPSLHPIQLNGVEYSIRPNLYHALQRVRQSRADVLLWVDSLCINQFDDEERTLQVERMATIYQQATEVCIWLGERDSSSDEALSTLEAINRPTFTWPPTWWEAYGFVAISRLMYRPWFQRGWIIQEAAFAQRAVLICGANQIDLSTFRAASESIMTVVKQRAPAQHEATLGSFRRFREAFQEAPASRLFELLKQIRHQAPPLETLVAAAAYTNTTKECDAIYSLLNLAQEVRLSPDYKKHWLEVYADFISHCAESGSLDILCRPWAPISRSRTAPSWLRSRDFSRFGNPSQISDTQQQQHAKPLVGDGSQDKLYRRGNDPTPHVTANFSASLVPSTERSNIGRPIFDGSLNVAGIYLGKVACASMRIGSAIISADCLRILDNSSSVSNPPDDFIPDSIWRTLCADRDKNGDPAPSHYGSYFARLLQQEYSSRALPLQQSVWKALPGIDIEEAIAFSNGEGYLDFLETVKETVWNRRACRISLLRSAEDSVVGLIPPEARTGDTLCVLYGCSVPVVLREAPRDGRPDGWSLIGEAYVHGMMDGAFPYSDFEEDTFRIV